MHALGCKEKTINHSKCHKGTLHVKLITHKEKAPHTHKDNAKRYRIIVVAKVLLATTTTTTTTGATQFFFKHLIQDNNKFYIQRELNWTAQQPLE